MIDHNDDDVLGSFGRLWGGVCFGEMVGYDIWCIPSGHSCTHVGSQKCIPSHELLIQNKAFFCEIKKKRERQSQMNH